MKLYLSHLQDHFLIVTLNSEKSEWISIPHIIPQGSVWSQLLFSHDVHFVHKKTYLNKWVCNCTSMRSMHSSTCQYYQLMNMHSLTTIQRNVCPRTQALKASKHAEAVGSSFAVCDSNGEKRTKTA